MGRVARMSNTGQMNHVTFNSHVHLAVRALSSSANELCTPEPSTWERSAVAAAGLAMAFSGVFALVGLADCEEEQGKASAGQTKVFEWASQQYTSGSSL